MENLQLLARLSARALFTDKQVVIIDILCQHPTMKEDELAFQTKLNLNQLRKVLGRLRADRFVGIEYRTEQRKTDQTKTVQRIYYYINYKSLYDCIKFKIWKIQKHFQLKSHSEKTDRGYYCPTCLQKFSAVDVMFYRHGSQQLFRCPNHLQDYYLQLEEEKESASYQKLTKFIQTVEPIVQLLKTLEGQKLSLYRPGQTVVSETGEMVEAGRHDRKDTSNGGRQLAVAQEGQDGQQKVSVEIHATGEAASLTAEAEQEKERIRKQNELPIWHKQSVINGVSANVSATTGTTSAIPVTTATSSSIVLGDEAQSQPVSIVTGGVATKLTGEDLSNEAEEDIMDYYNQYYANYAAKAAAVKPNEQPVKSDVKMDDASVKTISIDSSRSIKAQLIEEIDSEMIDSDEDEEFIEAT